MRWWLQRLACSGLLAATAAAGQGLGEVALEVPAGELDAVTGQGIELQVVKTRGGSAAVGEQVHWQLEDPASGRIDPIDDVTRAGGDGVTAGSARARFTAARSGRHGITVATPVDPGCTGADCRMFTRRIVVLAAAPAAGSGPGARDLLLIGGSAVAAMALIGSGDDGDRPQDGLVIVSGNNQSALANNPLPEPLVVDAGSGGGPAAGKSVVWTATGGAQLSANRTTVAANGRTSVDVLSVGPGPGNVTITACLDTEAQPCVQFTATANVAGLQKVSGDNQIIPVDSTTPVPLRVRTTLNGNPQAGVAVNWQVSGAGSLSGITAVSDASGFAQAFVDAGPFPGNISVVVSRVDAPSATQTFSIESIETRDLVKVSGDGQSAAQGQPAPAPLVVRALDNGGPDPGVTILWSATGGAVLSATSSVSDGAGNAQVTVTDVGMGTGPVTVFASRADVPSLSVSFTIAIDPPVLDVVSGDAQSGLAGTPAAAPLVVQLRDALGNGIAGQPVQWTVMSGSATLSSTVAITDTGGFAQVDFTFGPSPGPVSIRASAFSGAATAMFSATSLAPGALAPAGGDNQTGDPGDTLPQPLVVDIGSPTAGVPITFAVIQGQATLSTYSTVTDTGGQASTIVTLGTRPGTVIVRATGPGGISHDFTLTITGTVVVSGSTIVGGDGQELAIGVPSAPMIVELIDTGTSAPLAGVTVHWSTTNGTLANATTVTDTSGRTSNTVTISSAGPATVTASFPTVDQYDGTSVVFHHNGPLAAVPNLPVNEASVAEALDAACGAIGGGGSTPGEQDLVAQCTALAAASGSDPVAVGEALSAMLPDVAQTQADAGQAAVGAQFENLQGRIVQLRSGMPLAKVSFNGLNLAMAGGQVPLATLGALLMDADPAASATDETGFAKWGFFVSGNIGRGEADPTSLTPAYDFDVNGLTAGFDYRVNDNLVLGIALGYTSQDTDLANAQGSVDTRGFSLSGYGTWYVHDAWYLDGVLTFARNDYDHERRIAYVLPGVIVDQVAVASSDGQDLSATLTFGRDWQNGPWQLGLYGRAQYNRMSFDAFEESVDPTKPGAGLALRVESRDVTGTSAILGGKIGYVHSASWGVLIPQLEVEWQNDFESDAEAFRGYFIDDPTGTPILVLGDDMDSKYFRVGLGMSMVLTGGRSGFITYERIVGRSGIEQDMLTLGFRWEF
ncbi:hypothetical protein P873_09660 [Arenimonas composti TR7-09 = DSM 18010]|uniref:Autotransporter domain-containing protein n=1 Tax=Arenimonas composti TR7-09 = DSM 18010 TaxID=1121013 RepID=A0A091BAD1_9GAMM|nr:hypothetical protein P873_09660 [Arenimonas composti TR7-09 = DSM 18010]